MSVFKTSELDQRIESAGNDALLQIYGPPISSLVYANISSEQGNISIELDGVFTAEELKAIVDVMSSLK